VSAEHQDVMAVDLVQQLTRAEPQQLRLRRVQSKSAGTQPGNGGKTAGVDIYEEITSLLLYVQPNNYVKRHYV